MLSNIDISSEEFKKLSFKEQLIILSERKKKFEDKIEELNKKIEETLTKMEEICNVLEVKNRS